MKSEQYTLKEVTPEALRCGIGPCPAIYEMQEVTPKKLRCGVAACPAVYRCSSDYVIVGKQILPEEAQGIRLEDGRTLADKIGTGEVAMCFDKRIIDEREQKVVG